MIKKALFLTCVVASVLGAALFFAQPISAATPQTQFAACEGGSFFGFPSWDSCLPKKNGAPAITKLTDVWLIVFPIVESLIKAAGYMAVGFIIWGGIKYIKSQGEPGETTAARTIIQNAVIGLVICILSVAIVQFIASSF
jgi:hypothetical protein